MLNDDVSYFKQTSLQCRHIFHQHCITDWLMRHNDCPCCRTCYILPHDTAGAGADGGSEADGNEQTQSEDIDLERGEIYPKDDATTNDNVTLGIVNGLVTRIPCVIQEEEVIQHDTSPITAAIPFGDNLSSLVDQEEEEDTVQVLETKTSSSSSSSKQTFKRKSHTSPSRFAGGHGTTFVAGYTSVSYDHDDNDDIEHNPSSLIPNQLSSCQNDDVYNDDDDRDEQVSRNEGKNDSRQ